MDQITRRWRRIVWVGSVVLVMVGVWVIGGRLQGRSGEVAESITPSVEPLVRVVGLDIGDIAPDFHGVIDSGETLTLSDLRGQAVLLNFWASWCGPCRVEMPEFQRQYVEHEDAGFTVVAVNNAESPDVVRGFREELGLTFPIVLDQSSVIQTQYAVLSYPATFLLDRNGVIVARHFGVLTADQIDQMIGTIFR